MSPFGLPKAGGKALVDKILGKGFDQRAFAEVFGRSITGFAVAWSPGWQAYQNGYIERAARHRRAFVYARPD